MPCVCLCLAGGRGSIWRPAEFLLGTLPHVDKVVDKRLASLMAGRGPAAVKQLDEFFNAPIVSYLQRKMASLNRYRCVTC